MSMLSKYEADYIRKKKWYDQVDLYICPSDFYRDKLTGAGFTKSPVVTMRNPLPLNTQFGGGKMGDYVLYFGRLSEEKGVKTLLAAAKETGCRLVVLGTGPAEAVLKEYAKDMPNVEFKGFQTGKALEDFVKNSLCVVLPSQWYENGPYSAMEAMAAGKPLIVSGNGGLPELVDEGENGYVYRGGAAELAEAIRKMLALTGEEYEKMSLRAVEKAKALFDPMGYVEWLEKQYGFIKGETADV